MEDKIKRLSRELSFWNMKEKVKELETETQVLKSAVNKLTKNLREGNQQLDNKVNALKLEIENLKIGGVQKKNISGSEENEGGPSED